MPDDIDRPDTPFEIIRMAILTGISFGDVIGLLIANSPLIGGAVGAVAGFALGWVLRNHSIRQFERERNANLE